MSISNAFNAALKQAAKTAKECCSFAKELEQKGFDSFSIQDEIDKSFPQLNVRYVRSAPFVAGGSEPQLEGSVIMNAKLRLEFQSGKNGYAHISTGGKIEPSGQALSLKEANEVFLAL